MGYEAPLSLAGVREVLARDAGDWLLVAGGQSLLPHLARQALAADYVAPGRLLDLTRVVELREWRLADGVLFLGAGLTVAELLGLEAVRRLPVLVQALGHIGNVTIRNRATVGGCLAWADARAELPLVALLYGGTVVTLRGRVAMADFILGPNKTALAPGDVILGLELPLGDEAGAFLELMPRRSFGRAVVSLAGLRTEQGLRLALGGLVDRPVCGHGGTEWIDEVAGRYPALGDPVFPLEYRRAMAERLVTRLEGVLA
ncbi:FAD binding domain-containing protein [Govanella unica]|uniref:FAD binding domain-containing protein n=1 Tax=Govanella unica TaxID=2975056 RepID=A0A9X3TYI1_9PROT|nr:FAD binding domain-containing protein [Govania unica]MDA5194128.1 FAD binding domain-containing protein [Govania unica]